MKTDTDTEQEQYHAFEDGAQWGVGTKHAVLYDPMFSEPVAKRLAELENSNKPPKDWEAAERILIREGLLSA